MALRSATPEGKASQRASNAAFYASVHGLAVHMVTQARKRAKAKGVPFGLDVVPIEMRVRLGFCEATGLRFDLTPHDGETNNRPFAPCIDRVNGSKGYVWSNIRVVCNIFNHAKHDYSDGEVLAMAQALVARQMEAT